MLPSFAHQHVISDAGCIVDSQLLHYKPLHIIHSSGRSMFIHRYSTIENRVEQLRELCLVARSSSQFLYDPSLQYPVVPPDLLDVCKRLHASCDIRTACFHKAKLLWHAAGVALTLPHGCLHSRLLMTNCLHTKAVECARRISTVTITNFFNNIEYLHFHLTNQSVGFICVFLQ